MENVRKKLRPPIKLIEKTRRKPVYSDFEDEIGAGQELQLPGFESFNFERFREKALAFLRSHTEEPAIQRLRANELLTGHDLNALERLLKQVGSPAELAQAKQASEGFGLFLRSLVGLDRAAAKSAFNTFLAGKTPTANQIEFIEQVVNCLTEQGYLAPARLYESPFTDMSPLGVEGLFPPNQTTELNANLSDIRNRASAAAAA